MDTLYYIKVISAFVFVVSLMYLIGWAVRRFGGKQMDAARLQKSGDSQMRIVDSIVLDFKRRLIVVDYAGKGYMVMLGAQSETVVATDIPLKKQEATQDD